MAKDAKRPDSADGTGVGAGPHSDIAGMGYEQARDELVDLVARLESGQVGLEESVSLWERGEALAAHCTAWLDRAEATISGTDG